jgi:FhuF 2Fe-2S C-terminal domain
MPATSASYARLSAVFPGLRITAAPPRSGTGWSTTEQLARGGRALDAFVARDTAQVTHEHGRPPRPDVAATLALHRYLWPACLLFTVPWFLHRRVPRLPVADVSFHRATGRMTVRTRSFSCLPDDPAARLPGARTVRSADALRDELRGALAEHAGPVLDGFRPLLRRGPRALWGMVTDEIAEGLWYVGRLLGEEERAVAELAALLPGGTAPYAGSAGFHRPGSDDLSVGSPARERLTCCLFYTISPTDTCAACPRTCGGDRIRRAASAA